MKLVVWPDLHSKVVPDAEVRDLLRAYPRLKVHDFDQPWSGKYLACVPERPRPPTAVTHGRLPERYRTAEEAPATRTLQRWGQVAREREELEAVRITGLPADR